MVLLERDIEVAAIAAAVAAAEGGHGSVILVSGPAGIGKTAVLARGGALERELGVARQLLEPALVDADRATRTRLLRGTGRPCRGGARGSRGQREGDPSAVLHGLHRLVVNLAGERPLLLEVDDLQWADAASLRSLAFLGRRIATSRVVPLVARCTGE